MDTLPEALQWKIMMYNRHPCAEIMHGLLGAYRYVLEIQRKSKDRHFRHCSSPSFFDWKLHGIGCDEWSDLFQARQEGIRKTCILDRLGDRRLDSLIQLWDDERDQLLDLEYKF